MMKKSCKLFLAGLAVVSLFGLAACGQSKSTSESKDKKIDFILDWSPNTNHTGLYVAKEKGYFKEAGVDVDIKLPPEDSTSDLIINGKAPFGIYFQDSMAKKLDKGAEITAVAAIVEHNTSGIISKKSAGINGPKDLAGKKYGTWNDPVELGMLKTLVESQGSKFDDVEKVPNNDSNSITPIENGLFDAAWIYHGWDGIMAQTQGMDTNFFYMKDYVKEFDYYSPVIIANNDYLKKNPDEAKKVLQAIKKGYQYAMEHPEEAADILIKNAPELKNKRDFVLASQKYLSEQYASDKDKWGQFEASRWNAFYKWAKDNDLVKNDLSDKGFSNDYINVSYAYDEQQILKDINLEVEAGQVVAILGPSGVGKSTLFNLIAGILEVQSGRIILDGQENPKGRVSYMLQKDLLLEHKTVLGNVILPLLIRKVSKKEATEQATQILKEFGLFDVADKYPHELSGGMRQRVALLRTYMFGHKLFLLDEAFSALDELTKMELHAWYLDIHRRLGLTTLLITHSIEEALALSDRIYILKNRPGQIVANLQMTWSDNEDKELQKLRYKRDILKLLGM